MPHPMHTGSICFGSLLVAVLAFFRVLVRSMKDRRLAFAACLVDWILIKIENMMKFFNTYAFVYIALYAARMARSVESIYPSLCSLLCFVCGPMFALQLRQELPLSRQRHMGNDQNARL